MKLDEALRANKGIGPGFHMLRHVLAALILTHHCRVAVWGVHGNEFAGKGLLLAKSAYGFTKGQVIIELMRPGLFALVGMFFALSGFLVVASALRSHNIKVFFVNRAARILPALSMEITLSALLLGPLVTTTSLWQYFSDPQFVRYFGNIAGFVTYELPGVFLNNPWPGTVNANLWTLPPEFWCYFLMLGMMLSGLLLHQKWITVAIVGSVIIATALDILDHKYFSVKEDTTHFTVWYIVMMFLIGTAFYINSNRIILNFWLALGSATGYYVLTLFDFFGALSGVLLTYCAVYIGMMSFPAFDRRQKDDISYGIYLYGFPLTQAVIYFLMPHIGLLPTWLLFMIILPISFGLTIIFATLSWKNIEKPALQLRRYSLNYRKLGLR